MIFPKEIDLMEYATDYDVQQAWAGTEYDTDVKLLKLLIQGGDPGETDFWDSSASHHARTRVGNVALSGTQYKFGNTAGYFNGTDSMVQYADSEGWDLGTGDFTLETWAYITSLPSSGNYSTFFSHHHGSIGQDSNSWAWFIYNNGESAEFAMAMNDGGWYTNFQAITGFTTNEWHHFVCARSSGYIYYFFDGVQQGSSVAFGYNGTKAYSIPLTVGGQRDESNVIRELIGYMDEARISKGIARWTSGFTPATSQYEPDQYTKLLLHFDSVDTLGLHDPIFYGTACVTNRVNSNYGNAGYLDGDGDYWTIPESSDWDVLANNTENWTVDAWIFLRSIAEYDTIVGHYQDTTHRWGFKLQGAGGLITDGEGWGGLYSDTGYIKTNRWHHVAMIKTGSLFGHYVDGQQIGYQSNSNQVNFSGLLYIGRSGYPVSDFFDGWMCDLRIEKGNPFSASPNSGKTDTITVPTSPHTAGVNTKLLLPFSDAEGTTTPADSTETHTLTAYGTAKTTSLAGKFNGGAMYFNGNMANYVYLAQDADWNVTSSNWAVDFWVKFIDVNTVNQVLVSTSVTYCMTIIFNETGAEKMGMSLSSNGTSWNIVGSALGTQVLASDTWYHIALTWDGADYRLFVNGTQDIKVTSSTGIYGTTAIQLARLAGLFGNFNGWMTELRWTKGSAVWTSDFTPQDAPYRTQDEYSGAWVERAINVRRSDAWERFCWDLRQEENIPDACPEIKIEVTNADAENTVYFNRLEASIKENQWLEVA